MKLKTIWGNEFFLKIISLVLAIIVWAYIIVVQNPEVDKTYKDIEIVFSDSGAFKELGLIATSTAKPKVSVHVKGSRKAVSMLSKDNIYAYIDLSAIQKTGEYTLPVNINLQDTTISVMDKSPYTFTVVVDKLVSAQKPVKIVLDGKVKEGFAALTPKVSEENVVISGPKNQLSGISYAEARVDISGAEADVVKTAEYKLMAEDGSIIENKNITNITQTLDVTVPVMNYKNVPIYANITEVFEDGTRRPAFGDFAPAEIGIAGELSVIENIESISLGDVYVHINGSENYKIPLVLQGNVYAVPETDSIIYTPDNREITKGEAADIPIEIVGENNELSYSLKQNTVNVNLMAPADELKSLQKSKIKAVADVSGLSVGTHTIPVVITSYNKIHVVGEYNAELIINNKN